ncbi:hypothetical protein JG687_00004932 [Phytophthora cactorum]|uniref:VWFA domain-containing protein n=1 Tax=Phytophthora cactorum TaxID=29920 RepID=A0A8T1UQ68_9STRA|nr:hypothetical protein JG687_00004932 [Phytophthora cactorum]
MLDLLSPLRGYIAQNLQFYLSKYIEDIQLEGLGLFGGDLVLNDLEIKRHVLRESLEIPSSFDFSRGFIRELRIHIPWTQLLSQPIEVKLYTIELILTGKSNTARAASLDASVEGETEIDQPKSGWIHDMLQRILANVSVQINNLVLKYEHDDVVFSIALGTLDFYSASETDSWKRSFEELKGGRRAICKRIDAKDVTIFLDRYTSDGVAKEDTRQNPVRRKVVGYEVPVLSRTPSVTCDPFYYYSCNRSSVTPMYEVDVFIGELFFSPHLSGRYTWMEMSLWPAITVENVMDIPVALSFSQKLTTINLEVSPASEKSLSTINPFEPVDAQLQYGQGSSSANTSSKPMEFLLQCSSAEDSKEQIFVFEGCKVVVSFCNDHRPMIRIRTERILGVANMTPSDLIINIGSPLGNHGGALERIGSCVERSIGFTVVSNRLAVTIAAVEDLSSASDHIEWSPEVSLNVKGDTKPIVVLRSLASAYCIELVNSDGYLKLTIRPQVVVINSTVRKALNNYCIATGVTLIVIIYIFDSQVVSGCNAGWSVPVCLHKEAKKRSITADVSSWLSSKLSRRPSEDPSNSAKHALVARLSCSFRVSLVEDGYEWTEELAVLLPKISFLLSSDGKLRIAEPETSSSPTTNTQEGLYPAPSTTTYRRRLLIRHRGFRHKMLTYTMTQEGKSIHIMFFVDHQPPVIIHNQWGNMLGFRNMSFPSDPEGVGANFYLEYDWSLQVSAKHRKSIAEKSDTDDKKPNSESKLLSDWLEASSQSLVSADTPDTTTSERMRFQIGSPQFGWSNSVWQVGGIQFASFTKEEGSATAQPGPTFLVMCFYRAGSWLISITCLEDPMDAKVTAQRKVYVEWLEISNLQVTITARVSIPVLNSFDGTPLHFGSTEMREVFSFPDQLIKDLAADYVADTIVRSPVLLMSLNIIGNPAYVHMQQKSQMEAGEGANASLPSAESNGEDLFRLLKFVRETQCEMEVVKPVLDELEVMRMCRSFGMMSSVNPKDFDFNVLHAREFDDDFVRFLRFELFENACPGDVKLKGLFGKQAQVHHVFVLDCSGSMRGDPWEELVSGVRGYLQSRLAAGVKQDIVSVVTFGNQGIIEFEGVPIRTAPNRSIDFHGGGTFYSNGLNQANAIFSRTNLSVYKPVMIFFTDGRPADRKKGPALAVDVRKRFAKFGLRTFVVGYGRASDMGLEDLAEKLGGSVHEALTTADLREAFRSISVSLGARAGLIHTTTAA